MNVSNIEKKESTVAFQVTVDAEAFEAAVNKAYLKAKKTIMVPGFRKGKAPRAVVEGMYGTGVFYEDALDELAYPAFQAGLAEITDRTVGDPMITNYNVDEEKALTISFETTLYPEVTLGEYKGIEVYKAPAEVSAEDVDKEIESIRKRNARMVSVDREAANGDIVNIDYDGYKDGVPFDGGKADNFDLTLGSGQFVPGFEEQLIGCKAGEEKELNITFPEDYHKDLAGAAVIFKVKVNEVKENQLPELDDEFAKDVSEFDTLAEYRADVEKNLVSRLEESVERDFKNACIAKAAENLTVTIPDVMVKQRVDRMINEYASQFAAQGISREQYFQMMGIDENTFRNYMRPSAEAEVKNELLLEKIAEVEGVEVSEEEIEAEYATAAEAYGMEVEKVKEYIPVEMITSDVKMRKAGDLIVAAAVATDKQPEAETVAVAEEAAEDAEAPAEAADAE